MNGKRISLFNQTKDVKVGEATIKVQQMTWKSALLFASELSKLSSVLIGKIESIQNLAETDTEHSNIESKLGNLIDLLKELFLEDESLFRKFMSATTDLQPDELEALPIEAVADLLAVAIQINFSEGLIKKLSDAGRKMTIALRTEKEMSQTST